MPSLYTETNFFIVNALAMATKPTFKIKATIAPPQHPNSSETLDNFSLITSPMGFYNLMVPSSAFQQSALCPALLAHGECTSGRCYFVTWDASSDFNGACLYGGADHSPPFPAGVTYPSYTNEIIVGRGNVLNRWQDGVNRCTLTYEDARGIVEQRGSGESVDDAIDLS